MLKYQIKIVSLRNSILLIFLLLTLFLGGGILLKEEIKRIPMIIFVLMPMIIAYFMWQRFVTGRTEWTIDSSGIQVKWVKQFYLSNNEDINLKWNEIESISRGFDPNYYNLKIQRTSGQKIKFYHDTLTTKDDFKEFIKNLHQTFNKMKAN